MKPIFFDLVKNEKLGKVKFINTKTIDLTQNSSILTNLTFRIVLTNQYFIFVIVWGGAKGHTLAKPFSYIQINKS